MYPSLIELRAVLGVPECSEIEVESDSDQSATLIVAKWPCGCTASGIEVGSLVHLNCERHEEVYGSPQFPGDRRKVKRAT